MDGTTDFIDGLVENATAAGALVMDAPTPYLDVIGSFNASQQYPNVTHYSQVRPAVSLPASCQEQLSFCMGSLQPWWSGSMASASAAISCDISAEL